MAEEQKKPEGAAGDAPPKSKKKLFIIVGAVAALAIGGGAFLMLGGKKEEPKAEVEEVEHEKVYATSELPTLIVNLSDASSFLKVTMQIEYDAEALEGGGKHGEEGGEAKGGGSHDAGGGGAGKGLPGSLGKREGIVKDAIIRTISSRKAEDLLTVEGKDKLKEDLIDAINESSGVEEPVVVGVYFTEFLIQ